MKEYGSTILQSIWHIFEASLGKMFSKTYGDAKYDLDLIFWQSMPDCQS